MKPESHARAPRAQLICHATSAVLRSSGTNLRKLASAIAENYQAMVAEHERVVTFHSPGNTIDQALKAEKANAQLITRFLDGTVKFPADLEEAWVAALPEPFRLDLSRELVRRHGFIGARQPCAPDANAAAVVGVGEVAKEFAEVVHSLAPIFSDGKVCPADHPHIARALKETRDLQAALATLEAQLTEALPLARTKPRGS